MQKWLVRITWVDELGQDSNQELGSILQRHAMVHLLLHLGIDVKLS